MIETVHSGIYPSKLGTKLLESMLGFQAFFMFATCLIWIGQSPPFLSLYQVYHISFITYSALMHHTDAAYRKKTDSRPDGCVQVLSSERKASGITWVNSQPLWRAWRRKNEHGSVRRQETGDRRLASLGSWEMHRVPRPVCLESFVKGLKLSFFGAIQIRSEGTNWPSNHEI